MPGDGIKPRGEKENIYVKPTLKVGRGKSRPRPPDPVSDAKRLRRRIRSDKYALCKKIVKSLNPTPEEIIKLQLMEYSAFLVTPYWHKVADVVRLSFDNKCADCGADDRLQVHHLTYKNHGREHLFWRIDLIPVCDRCHERRHSKSDNQRRIYRQSNGK